MTRGRLIGIGLVPGAVAMLLWAGPAAHAHRPVPGEVKPICRKGRRRVAKGGHVRCVRIHKKKTAYRPKRTKEIRR